jgi:uncharacterized coiled-coil protein SlyX
VFEPSRAPTVAVEEEPPEKRSLRGPLTVAGLAVVALLTVPGVLGLISASGAHDDLDRLETKVAAQQRVIREQGAANDEARSIIDSQRDELDKQKDDFAELSNVFDDNVETFNNNVEIFNSFKAQMEDLDAQVQRNVDIANDNTAKFNQLLARVNYLCSYAYC